MPIRHSPRAIKHRSQAWSSSAETQAPVMAESSTRLKQAAPEADELEQDIQASLSAALDDIEKLELFAPEPEHFRAFKPKIPRGMPPLPHGRRIPPLPVSRSSLVPRLLESLRPKPGIGEHLEPEVPVGAAPFLVTPALADRPRRWPGVALVLLTLAVLGAVWWWLQL